MPLPDGWPAQGAVETLPAVWLAMAGSSWPPAVGDRPAGVAPVGSWSCERELVGSVLPGNVRTRTGLSIGVASAEVGQVDGVPLSPWSKEPGRRVVTGAAADLYAAYDGHDTAARIDLGDWQVDPASGGLLSPGVQVELIERQYAGRVQANLLPTAYEDVDPAWVIATMARQVGYDSTPRPVPSAIVAAPMSGGNAAEVGDLQSVAPAPGWNRSTGPLSPAGGMIVQYAWPLYDVLQDTGVSVFLTLNVVGTVEVRFGALYDIPACSLEIDEAGTLKVRNGGTPPTTSVSFTPGLDEVNQHRVQVEMQRTYSTPGDPASSTAFRARARSEHGGTWSAWATHTSSSTREVSIRFTLLVDDGSSFSAVQLTRDTEPELWAAPTADIDPLGGRMVGPWLPAAMDAWSAIQAIAGAHLGAVWVTRDKVLVCRDRDYLAGTGGAVKTIDVGASVEELGWTLDPGDSADRLEVTFTPADVQDTNIPALTAPVAWEASEVVELPPGQVVEVVADREFFCNLLEPNTWYPAWNPDTDSIKLATWSAWSAFPNRDGSGTHAADDAVSITHREVSSGRVIITLRNNTGATLYTVDSSGQPLLVLRGYRKVGHDITTTVTRGVDADAASNVLTIDLSPYVQRAEDAEAIADYVWARVSSPAWKASSVRVRLDWTTDIGDVVDLAHERSDLDVRALVTKVAYEGSAGQISQALDLVLLPTTWVDFDGAWVGQTWADFDAEWADQTWADFDDDPTRSA